MSEELVKCPICDGSGEVHSHNPRCWECNGSGMVDAPVLFENKDDLPGGSTPSQYALPPEAKELQDLIEYREMNFAMGNIFKACYRKKDVGDPLYDIRKIIWFAKREEARLMNEVKDE